METSRKPDFCEPSSPQQEIPESAFADIRERLLIESVKSAFGIRQHGGVRKPCYEAWEWILSENREMPFSFATCCREWGVDPETMVEWLRYYRKKMLG